MHFSLASYNTIRASSRLAPTLCYIFSCSPCLLCCSFALFTTSPWFPITAFHSSTSFPTLTLYTIAQHYTPPCPFYIGTLYHCALCISVICGAYTWTCICSIHTTATHSLIIMHFSLTHLQLLMHSTKLSHHNYSHTTLSSFFQLSSAHIFCSIHLLCLPFILTFVSLCLRTSRL